MKKTFSIIGILILIGGAFYGGMIVMSDQKDMENRYKSPEELKNELKQNENRFPTSYLELETRLENNIEKGGLFKKEKIDGQIISGLVKNKATVATYKDVVVELKFYSKTETEIGKQSFVIYEAYPPNSEKEFNYRIEIPNATDTYKAIIKDAKPVY